MVEMRGRERGREALERQPQKHRQHCSHHEKDGVRSPEGGSVNVKKLFFSERSVGVCERQIGRVCACVRACVHAYVSEREVVN